MKVNEGASVGSRDQFRFGKGSGRGVQATLKYPTLVGIGRRSDVKANRSVLREKGTHGGEGPKGTENDNRCDSHEKTLRREVKRMVILR